MAWNIGKSLGMYDIADFMVICNINENPRRSESLIIHIEIRLRLFTHCRVLNGGSSIAFPKNQNRMHVMSAAFPTA